MTSDHQAKCNSYITGARKCHFQLWKCQWVPSKHWRTHTQRPRRTPNVFVWPWRPVILQHSYTSFQAGQKQTTGMQTVLVNTSHEAIAMSALARKRGDRGLVWSAVDFSRTDVNEETVGCLRRTNRCVRERVKQSHNTPMEAQEGRWCIAPTHSRPRS
jgi:hypothetical protein